MSAEPAFGSWLKHHRKQLDLTQDELARRIGCSAMLIQKIEADERRPSKQIAELLAACLAVPAEERADFVRFARSNSSSFAHNASAPWRALRSHLTNLPAPPSPLIGRARDLETIVARLAAESTRLVTLVGPAGVGKTRLAIACAEALLDRFDDGAFFVPLASVRDPDLVAVTIGQTLGIKESSGRTPLQRLQDHLADKRLLLVLDNLEQVVAAAPLIADFLANSRSLKILATSRVSLHIRPERQYHVAPLPLAPLERPEADSLLAYPAIELFVDRAQAVDMEFALNAANGCAVAEICAHLDGLPLAIELVAARIQSLTPQEMLRQLSHRLSLVMDGPRDLPKRHQSLREAIGWSYGLLNTPERVLFTRLAVFSGGFTREAARAVCQLAPPDLDVDAALEALIDSSLVAKEVNAGGETRLSMLETIREYAFEQLASGGESEEISRRHAEHFCEFAESARPHLTGPDQVEWVSRLYRDKDNLRAALQWALDHSDAPLALRIANALFLFWYREEWLLEGRKWFKFALDLPAPADMPPLLYIKGFYGAGYLAWSQGDYVAAQQFGAECQRLATGAGDKKGIADALSLLAIAAVDRADYAAADELYRQDLSILRELGDQAGLASVLNNLGRVAFYRGEPQRGIPFYEESLALRRALGDRFNIALTLNNLGGALVDNLNLARAREVLEQGRALSKAAERPYFVQVHTVISLGRVELYSGNYARADELLQEGLAQGRERQSKTATSSAALYLGALELARNNLKLAEQYLREALALQRPFEEKGVGIRYLDIMAALFREQGDLASAATLCGAIESVCQAAGVQLPPAYVQEHTRTVSAARAGLDEQSLDRAWQQGGGMTLAQAFDFALQC